MSITVNTNVQALKIQTNLSNATAKMNSAMERLSSGAKINSAADDAAGSTISTNLEATLSSSKVASQNAQIGSNLLTTAEGTLNTISSNLQRIRDLAEQAANGTYDQTSRDAMKTEVAQRAAEIDRLATNTKFNGMQIFGDTTAASGAAAIGVDIQVGTGGTGADNTINLDKQIFAKANVTALQLSTDTTFTTEFASPGAAKTFLNAADNAIKNITDRKTLIGAYQNRLSSAMSNLSTQQTNLASTNSTIKDADTAEESANYVKYQILQQASASLLTTANSQPQIALSLIKG